MLNTYKVPQDRQSGWIEFRRRVIYVDVKDGIPNLFYCFICSTPSTHYGVDNIKNLVVSSLGEPFNSLADDYDDAHEKSVMADDPHVMTREEAEFLRNRPEETHLWFGGLYSMEISTMIATLLLDSRRLPERTH